MRCVFIHGPAASGKLTVASALQSLTGLPLFHNHLAVDAALALFAFGSPQFIRLRESIWLSAFREASQAAQSFIFTFHPEASVPSTFVNRAVEIVEQAGGEVLFVALTCPEAEIERRMENASRSEFRKLNSIAQYRRLRDSGAFVFPSLPSPALEIATDKVSPANAARMVQQHLVTLQS